MDDDQVRIPELPIFKRFSLALRQEFADASEVLSYLETTTDKVRLIVDRAERMKMEQGAGLQPPTDDQAEHDPEHFVPQDDGEAASVDQGRAPNPPKSKGPAKPARRKPVKRPQVIRVPDDVPSQRATKKSARKGKPKTRRQ